jgi:hypothetical protein
VLKASGCSLAKKLMTLARFNKYRTLGTGYEVAVLNFPVTLITTEQLLEL